MEKFTKKRVTKEIFYKDQPNMNDKILKFGRMFKNSKQPNPLRIPIYGVHLLC